MTRGYYGIGIFHPKTESNMGSLWRSAHNFGAGYIFTVGRRYKPQCSDTTKAWKHLPMFEYEDWDRFLEGRPRESALVFVEQSDESTDLREFKHPERAVYILGAEDHGIPEKMMIGHHRIAINTPMCLNVAVAGSIVMFDRQCKGVA